MLNRIVTLLCVMGCSSLVTAQELDRPNILVLMAEDMSARVGAFGDPVAVTPNIDRLAQQGTRYPNTFTTAGVCAPSRAAHILGMHQISTGAQHMRTGRGPHGSYTAVPPEHVKAYPELLRGAGYYTWTDQKLDYQFSGTRANSGPFTIWTEEGSEGHWRHRRPGQPFYGLINFGVTHESGVFTPLGSWPNSITHLVMQLMRTFMIPDTGIGAPVSPEQISVPPYYPDVQVVRADMARHYNNIAAMDAEVGTIVGQLESDGLLESTIVIWTTDHGDGLPRSKRELFDSGIKVPMVIRWPERFRPADAPPNGIDSRLISFIDLAPTLLTLAGVEQPDYLQGSDFLSDAPRKHIFASRDRIDEVEDRQRAVRSDRYKYIRSWFPQLGGGHALAFRDNLEMMRELRRMFESGELNEKQRQWFEAPGEERLFDIEMDPYELNNLADNKQYAEVLHEMRGALADWLGRVDDLSEQSEVEMVARFWPNGEQPLTASPELVFSKGKIRIKNRQANASLGYRLDEGDWQLYTAPVVVDSGVVVGAKAVRYGWQESEPVTGSAP